MAHHSKYRIITEFLRCTKNWLHKKSKFFYEFLNKQKKDTAVDKIHAVSFLIIES